MGYCGRFFIYLTKFLNIRQMYNLIGEFECKIDSKSRLAMPSQLKKQFGQEDQYSFVMNRGFEKCLVLYPQSEWDKISEDLSELNYNIKKDRDFVRYFLRGATSLTLDGNNRLLLPKSLMKYAGIEKEIILFAAFNKVEVWSKSIYENLITDEPDDFANLAEEVRGRSKNTNNKEDK